MIKKTITEEQFREQTMREAGFHLSTYAIVGVYHTLLPRAVQDELKKGSAFSRPLSEKDKAVYLTQVHDRIVQENPTYFSDKALREVYLRMSPPDDDKESEPPARPIPVSRPAVKLESMHSVRKPLVLLRPRNKKS